MPIKPLILVFIFVQLVACGKNDHHSVQGYVEGEQIFLASPYNGSLEQLNVVRGQHVSKGELLFKLDSNPQSMNIDQVEGELSQAQNTLADLQKPRRAPEILAIEAQIEQAKSNVALAEVRVARFQKLYDKQASDKDTLDAAKANLEHEKQIQNQYEANLELAKLGGREDQIKAQKAQINSLSAKLKLAKWELAQKTVIAPSNGVIFDTYFRKGEFVGSQQPVVSLLAPENIRIEFFVPLNVAPQIHVGQKIQFTCEGCAANNSGIITYISPDAEFVPPLVYSRENYEKLVFRIKAQIANPQSFKPGQPVEVTIHESS